MAAPLPVITETVKECCMETGANMTAARVALL